MRDGVEAVDDILNEFLVESNENLERLDLEVVQLELEPDNLEVLKSIFRTIHTVKGSCGFLGLTRMESVSHAAEDVLGKMRDGQLPVTAGTIGPVLDAVDTIKSILRDLETEGREPEGDDSAVIAALREAVAAHGLAEADIIVDLDDALAEAGLPDAVPRGSDADGEMTPVESSRDASAAAEGAEAQAASRDAATPAEPAKQPQEPTGVPVANQSLRVSVSVLDRLMNRVGELVLVRNQLAQLTQSDEGARYGSSVAELGRVTTELQEAVMQTRMRDIGSAWKKIPRILRNLTAGSGKKINLKMVGADTELDRQVLDAIEDPFMHMVRNSADHGIESIEARRAHGKSDEGTITLRARQQGGSIIVEIIDDGAGIDIERVRAKAIERGLIDATKASSLPEDEVLNMIFEPGFSTADQVTSVSGRGVGMDVVRSKIQSIGGTIRLRTRAGEGTTVYIKIPLTLAIISALIVSGGGRRFAIPQVGVVELVRVSDDNRHLIEVVNGAEALRLRGRLLSLVQLGRILGLERSSDSGERYVIVIQVDKKQFGLVVDDVHDTEEIVVKPLGRFAGRLRVYAGTTILGDGSVIMILDAAGLAARAGILARLEIDRHDEQQAGDELARRSVAERVRLLLFRSGGKTVQAIPLSLVTRLEEIPAKKIERASGGYLIQYRGSLLPLVPVDDELAVGKLDPQPVIVFRDGSRSIGLMVEQINDIAEETISIETFGRKTGVIGSAVIKDRVTEILDLHHYLKKGGDDWFSSSTPRSRGSRVLVVDDSDFFRNMLAPLLRGAGHEVSAARDGIEALEVLGKGGRPDVILCDIEMPNMDGLELAREVRRRPELAGQPLIALTSRTSPHDVSQALEAGFLLCIPKLDMDAVLDAIENVSKQTQEALAGKTG